MAIPYVRETWVDNVTEISDDRLNNIEETLTALASTTPSPGDIPMWDAGQGKFVFSPGRGEPNGVAALDATGKVPAGQLPGVSGGTIPAGAGMVWFAETAPSGWALCDGSTIVNAQASNPELWANINPTWKSGANVVLPNLKGRIPVGKDAAQGEFDVLGEVMGAKSHVLAAGEMPYHNHEYYGHGTSGGATPYRITSAWSNNQVWVAEQSGYAGGNQPHNNLQPGIVVNWIIKL